MTEMTKSMAVFTGSVNPSLADHQNHGGIRRVNLSRAG